MQLPTVGFGTYKLSKPTAYTMVLEALKEGYRLIDTAQLYCNERSVADALRDTDTPREDIILCTKVSTRNHKLIEKYVRQRLRIFDYIDVLYLHWPSTFHIKGWNKLCKIQAENSDKIKHIGICNISKETLEDIVSNGIKKPDIIQNEIHPFCYDAEIYDYCRKEGIKVISHSCFMFGKALEHPDIKAITQDKKPSQVLIKWSSQKVDTVLTRCDNTDYLRENINIDDIDYIEIKVNQAERLYPIK